MNLSSGIVSEPYRFHFTVIVTTANAVSILACSLATALVVRLNLHQNAVYRLALYQLLASLTLATVGLCHVVFVHYLHDKHTEAYGMLCITTEWLVVYPQWMKLQFAMWVSVHLFNLRALQRNLKKLETMFIATSLFVPAMISSVALVSNASGFGSWIHTCDGYLEINTAFIEYLTLWSIPAMISLIASFPAMVFMAIRVCRRPNYAGSKTEDDRQYWADFIQLLPLAAFPMWLSFFNILTIVLDVTCVVRSPTKEAAALLFIALWSFFYAATIVVCIFVDRLSGRHRDEQEKMQTLSSMDLPTVKYITLTANSNS